MIKETELPLLMLDSLRLNVL